MGKINFGIIGCGRIGIRHAEHINNLGNVVAVCDIDLKKAKALAFSSDAHYFDDVNKLLASSTEIDVISVCTPNGLHAEHSIKALETGHHVLCEKPMAITSQDCSKMIQAAERSNRRLFVVKQNRFNPPVTAVKKLIDEGKLGKILSIQLSCFWNRNSQYYTDSWKGTKDLDGGTLFTQFSHFIDLLFWLIGDVKKLSAITKNSLHKGIIDFEDSGVVILEFEQGAIGTINYNVNSYQKNMEGSLTIFGSLGTVKIGGQYLNELEYQNIKDLEIKNLPPGNAANNYGQYQGSMSNHDLVYKNLIDVLLNNTSINATMFDGFKTVEIIENIYESAERFEG
jgi:UDP-N-acetyl-2-amino-2-deoxyglucuronate dehydrogenase